MSNKMNILLQQTSANQPWDKSTMVTPLDGALIIHTQSTLDFEVIQQAARKIAAMGIKLPRLSGEGWCVESQFHFYQGFRSPFHQDGFEFAFLIEVDSHLL